MNGKGDKPRPLSVPREQFETNWESAFGKKPTPPKGKPTPPTPHK